MGRKRTASTATRWKIAGLVILAVAALAVAGIAILRPAGDPAAATYTPPPATLQPKKIEPQTVFFGDSYSQGAGASNPLKRWTTLATRQLGLTEVSVARGGTGYLATSDPKGCGLATCPNYREMIAEAVAKKPAVVIVSGGRNDLKYGTGELAPAVKAFFTDLRKSLPDAKIVAVAPWWDSSDAPPALTSLAGIIESEVSAVGGVYVDAGQPLAGHPEMIVADKVHPNDAGHAALAAAVVAAWPL